MPRKSQSQASSRAELSAEFLEAFKADFKVHGKGVIEKMRLQNPTKYVEVAARIIAAEDPPQGQSFKDAKDMKDIGKRLLVSVGLREPPDEAIEQAIQANNLFVATLERIAKAEAEKLN